MATKQTTTRSRSPHGKNVREHKPPQVVETPQNWCVNFDCAGMKEKEIHVSVHRRQVIVQARAHQKYAKNPSPPTAAPADQMLRFYQCVAVPRTVSQSTVTHKFENSPRGLMVVVTGTKAGGLHPGGQHKKPSAGSRSKSGGPGPSSSPQRGRSASPNKSTKSNGSKK